METQRAERSHDILEEAAGRRTPPRRRQSLLQSEGDFRLGAGAEGALGPSVRAQERVWGCGKRRSVWAGGRECGGTRSPRAMEAADPPFCRARDRQPSDRRAAWTRVCTVSGGRGLLSQTKSTRHKGPGQRLRLCGPSAPASSRHTLTSGKRAGVCNAGEPAGPFARERLRSKVGQRFREAFAARGCPSGTATRGKVSHRASHRGWGRGGVQDQPQRAAEVDGVDGAGWCR